MKRLLARLLAMLATAEPTPAPPAGPPAGYPRLESSTIYRDPRFGAYRVELTAAGPTGPIFETFEGFRLWISSGRPSLPGIGDFVHYPDHEGSPGGRFAPAFEHIPRSA